MPLGGVKIIPSIVEGKEKQEDILRYKKWHVWENIRFNHIKFQRISFDKAGVITKYNEILHAEKRILGKKIQKNYTFDVLRIKNT